MCAKSAFLLVFNTSPVGCLQVEAGLCDGAVLYHAHVTRSKAEVTAQQAARDEVARVKAQRRQQQEVNVRKKEVRIAG